MSALPGLIFGSDFGGVRAGGAYLVGRTDLLFARQRVGREGHLPKFRVCHVIHWQIFRTPFGSFGLKANQWRVAWSPWCGKIAVAPPSSFATSYFCGQWELRRGVTKRVFFSSR